MASHHLSASLTVLLALFLLPAIGDPAASIKVAERTQSGRMEVTPPYLYAKVSLKAGIVIIRASENGLIDYSARVLGFASTSSRASELSKLSINLSRKASWLLFDDSQALKDAAGIIGNAAKTTAPGTEVEQIVQAVVARWPAGKEGVLPVIELSVPEGINLSVAVGSGIVLVDGASGGHLALGNSLGRVEVRSASWDRLAYPAGLNRLRTAVYSSYHKAGAADSVLHISSSRLGHLTIKSETLHARLEDSEANIDAEFKDGWLEARNIKGARFDLRSSGSGSFRMHGNWESIAERFVAVTERGNIEVSGNMGNTHLVAAGTTVNISSSISGEEKYRFADEVGMSFGTGLVPMHLYSRHGEVSLLKGGEHK